jgi:hypothetical protein
LVQNHADPHFGLSGKCRQEYLEDALALLFDLLPQSIFLRKPKEYNA